MPRPTRPTSRLRAAVRVVASLAVAGVLLGAVLPRFADLPDVWETVRGIGRVDVAVLLAVAAWNIVTYQWVMMAALPGLVWRDAFVTGQISTAVSNTVPGGAIVGIGVTYGVLSSFGHDTAAIARASVLTGWWNALVKFGMPAVALLLLSVTGDVNEGLLVAASVGVGLLVGAIAVLVLGIRSDVLARRMGDGAAAAVTRLCRLIGRPPVTGWGDRFSAFREASQGLLRRRWLLLTGATVISHVSLFVVLLVSLRVLGVTGDDVTWVEVFGAFSFVQLATAIPVTPGGLGVVEVGMAGALVLAGGPEAFVVAAVLVYRALTYLFQVFLGMGSFVVWRLR